MLGFSDEVYDRWSGGDPEENEVEVCALPPAATQRGTVRDQRLVDGR